MIRILPLALYIPTIRGLFDNWIAGEPVNPFYASFKLTSRCHFGCPFCNVKKQPVPDLPTADVKAILDNLSRSSVLMTSFEGGEPLLREDIGELLAHARRRAFYLLFTTSVRNLLDYPLKEYGRYIDFLHISIDEGHNNLEMLELLPKLTELHPQVSVQTVVTRDTVGALEEKVRQCRHAGANIVVIAATHMDGAADHFPDMEAFERTLNELRVRYPDTIHTPAGYFDAYRRAKCSTASVIIAPDGRLYYPCHIQATKGPDLVTTDLRTWLKSAEAANLRIAMRRCGRNCGWYQYYSIDSYTSIRSVADALRPVLSGGRKKR